MDASEDPSGVGGGSSTPLPDSDITLPPDSVRPLPCNTQGSHLAPPIVHYSGATCFASHVPQFCRLRDKQCGEISSSQDGPGPHNCLKGASSSQRVEFRLGPTADKYLSARRVKKCRWAIHQLGFPGRSRARQAGRWRHSPGWQVPCAHRLWRPS